MHDANMKIANILFVSSVLFTDVETFGRGGVTNFHNVLYVTGQRRIHVAHSMLDSRKSSE